MVELCLTPHWKAIRWFLLTNRNLGQSQSEYFADVSTFVLLFSHIFSNQISLKVLFYHSKFSAMLRQQQDYIKINTDSTKVADVGHF